MLIGRDKEQQILLSALEADESQLIAVYGRRRVGKTFLIRQTYKNKFAFQHSGLSKGNTKEQINEFCESLRQYGLKNFVEPKNWSEAFHLLQRLLAKKPKGKKIIFIDELPWMDTHKSKFLESLDHFWNGWATEREDIVLIICGSATSWIINKVIRNRGGLHNRVNRQIDLQPFTLKECRQYADCKKLSIGDRELVEAYMVMGGVPFYWSFFQRGESVAKTIDRLFFEQNAELKDEYDALYESLFTNANSYMSIVKALSTVNAGMTRAQLLTATKLSNNTVFQKALRELEQCGFIRKYQAYGNKNKEMMFQLMDPFTLFYYHFLEGKNSRDEQFWQHSLGQNNYNAWAGIAFERVCLWHERQIKTALGISGLRSNVCAWSYLPTTEEKLAGATGGQIDLMIDRADGVINLCEMKFHKEPFLVTSSYAEKIRTRNAIFRERENCRKALVNTLVTMYGIVNNMNSDVFDNILVISDLLST
ncbi:MAG: ATP-binding protein [Paludibacteraceae bacterium]|nr:ATP-binding protein [Paludibacteraceae bacterium]